MTSTQRKLNQHYPTLAAVHGIFYIVTGIGPILHMKSFEKVSGPKSDRWLVKTVGALLAVSGGILYHASRRGKKIPDEVAALAVGQAMTLAAADVIYSSKGRISKIYLLDALAETALTAAWLGARLLPKKSKSRKKKTPTTRRKTAQRNATRAALA